MMEGKRPFKIWNCDRSVKKSVTASTLAELIEKGKKKLNLDATSSLKVVLEEDGTEVDEEDYFSFLPVNATLQFLLDNEQWAPRQNDDAGRDETDYNVADSVDSVEDSTLVLAKGLKQDHSLIIAFSPEQLKQLVDYDTDKLANALGESHRYTQSLQDVCQRHLDEKAQTKAAEDLLKLYHQAKENRQTGSGSGDIQQKKRKMEDSL